VVREILNASYLHAADELTISSASRAVTTGIVTVNTTAAHGRSVGDWVFIDGLAPNTSGGGNASGGGLNGLFEVLTVPLSTRFTYSTPEHVTQVTAVLSGGTVLPVTAEQDANETGPYLLDPVSGVALTETETTIDQQIDENQQYHILTVADASDFPDEAGYLCIGLGYDYQADSVPYYGRASNTTLLLDYSYRFTQTIPSGASCILQDGKQPFSPEDPATYGCAYITASNAGRAAAVQVLTDISAAGFDTNIETIYPGDRGLGAEGYGATGDKLGDKVSVWGSDDLDAELAAARDE
jgi:hypothetical protein